MRVAFVTGGRDLHPTQAQAAQFQSLMERYRISCIVHGDCPTGVDRWAKAYADDHGIWHVAVPALWKQYGGTAGPRRNTFAVRIAALLAGSTEKSVAIVFPGGRGTTDAAKKAKRNNFIMEAIDDG